MLDRGDSALSKIVLYAAFAFVAIAGNIFSQDISLRIYRGPYDLPVSILVGTAMGLIVKFVLDKRYVFDHTTNHVHEDAYLFVMYSAMGLATTVLFWSVEIGFELVFDSDAMRYVGGVTGLVLGYALKYQLDRRFVFGPARVGVGP